MRESIYTDPDAIKGLCANPSNQVLLAEYAVQTGSMPAEAESAALGSLAALGGIGGVLTSVEVQGQGGGGGNDPSEHHGGGGRTA